MDSETIYLLINDWFPKPQEVRFLGDYEINKIDREDLVKNKVGIRVELIDYSLSYYITAKKSWLEKNYPELLESSVVPKMEKHPEKNQYGLSFFTPD